MHWDIRWEHLGVTGKERGELNSPGPGCRMGIGA